MMSRIAVIVVAVSSLVLFPSRALAHCDSLDGPVVKAARAALETGKLEPVLAWVQPSDEAQIKGAFARAREVRKAGGAPRELADTWFFETLVRVHRAGEGAPYTGLKPAGTDPGPAVRAADAAIEKGSAAEVEKLLVTSVKHGLHERFEAVSGKGRPGNDVAAGRAWVAAYVPFVHWVEGVHAAAAGAGAHHAEAVAESDEPHAAGHGPEHQGGARFD